MAKNSIASANVLIAANADALNSGLRKAGDDVQKWSKSMGAKAGGGKAGKGIIEQAMGGTSMLKTLGPWGIAAAAGIGAAGLATKELVDTLGDIAKQGQIADALGLTAEQFTGIAGVAKTTGEDTREFTESLVTMGKLGRDAATGTEEASKAFADMGINATEFNKLRTDEQFFKVFESLKAMGDGGKRTGAIMKAFGDDGGKWLLPLLSKTPEELKKMAAGFAVTTEEMERAKKASFAMKTVEANLGKLWRSAAIMAAPLVEGIANVAMNIIDGLKPMFDWFGRAWKQVEEIAVPFWGMVQEEASALWSEIKTGFDDAFGWVGAELPTIQEVMVAHFRSVGTVAAYAWDTIKAGAGITALAFGKIIEMIGKLVRTFKDTVKEMLLNAGAAAKVLGFEDMSKGLFMASQHVVTIADGIENAGKGMQQWGANAIDGFGNSAAKWNSWLDAVLTKKKKVEDVIGAGPDTAIKSDPIKLGGAIERGSKEAYSMIVKNRYGIGDDDTGKKQLKAQEGIKKNGDKANDKLDGIQGALAAIRAI